MAWYWWAIALFAAVATIGTDLNEGNRHTPVMALVVELVGCALFGWAMSHLKP